LGAAVVLIVIAEWAGLALAGKWLARKMGNPDAWPLPLCMGGVLGVIVMGLASYPQASRARDLAAYQQQAA
jgi:hypothetical protein